MSDELSRLQCVSKMEFDPSTLTGTFVVINGPNGFGDTVKIWKMYNPSKTISLEISLDGVTPHDFLPPGGTMIIDCQTNHYDGGSFGAGTLNVAKGQILYGRTAANDTFIQIIGYR